MNEKTNELTREHAEELAGKAAAYIWDNAETPDEAAFIIADFIGKGTVDLRTELAASERKCKAYEKLLQYFRLNIEPFYIKKHEKGIPDESGLWELLAFVENQLVEKDSIRTQLAAAEKQIEEKDAAIKRTIEYFVSVDPMDAEYIERMLRRAISTPSHTAPTPALPAPVMEVGAGNLTERK